MLCRSRGIARSGNEDLGLLDGGRTIIALLENGQREDGTVVLPEALAQFGAPERLEAAA
jgi:seryl-tRNA synthetase